MRPWPAATHNPSLVRLSHSWFAGNDVKQKAEFAMPKISRTTIENAALSQGLSRSRSKRFAARVVARPDWDFIQGVLTERFWLPHADPTAYEALWNVLMEQLIESEVAA